jgi:exosortase E/protease (VPEID-CTERM system)
LPSRIAAVLGLLLSEGLITSSLFDSDQLFGWAGRSTEVQLGAAALWTAHFLIGFAAIFGTFIYLKHRPLLLALVQSEAGRSLNTLALAGHVIAFAAFLGLSFLVSQRGSIAVLALPWLASGALLLWLAGLVVLPVGSWAALLRQTGSLTLGATLGAATASSLVKLSGLLWEPMSVITFRAVEFVLRRIFPSIIVDPAHMRIGTSRCLAIISKECSGLEGAALMLVFLAIWLVIFREDVRFPQALLLVPAAVAALLSMNVLRIAALISIGHMGYPNVAAQGFHSEAGWILFNGTAFAIAVGARRIPWISRAIVAQGEARVDIRTPDRTAEFLLPFLALLSAGMLARAASGGFEWAYGIRTAAVLAVLIWNRRDYLALLRIRPGWMPVMLGVCVFAIWMVAAMVLPWTPKLQPMPVQLAAAPATWRAIWIAIRAITGIALVPIAEELAFRGFAMRRLMGDGWEARDPRTASWIAILVSSLAFGLMHGSRWLEASLAGYAYAWAYRRRGKLVDAVLSHAVTNFLVALYVIFSTNWSLW